MSLAKRAVAFSFAVALAFTPSPAPAAGCTPGQQINCGCPGGGGMTGVQTCNDAGTRFGQCVCAGAEKQPAKCQKDVDCQDDGICKQGQCEAGPVKEPGGCKNDGDCSGGEVCAERVCKANSAEPPKVETPVPAPAASTSDTGPKRCEDDIQCSPAQHCLDTVCVPRSARYSPKLLAAGIVLTSIGGLGLLGYFGVGMALYPNHAGNHPEATVPIGLVGGGMVVAGIILMAKGGAKRPIVDEPRKEPTAGMRLEPVLYPLGAGLRGTF
jgi:hypothetical protein